MKEETTEEQEMHRINVKRDVLYQDPLMKKNLNLIYKKAFFPGNDA